MRHRERSGQIAKFNSTERSLVCFGVLCVLHLVAAETMGSAGDAPFAAPASPRLIYNFDADWKFIRQDVVGAESPKFDDAKWESVSTPHTYNDVDTFNKIISHSGGQRGAYMGVAWYRKHFALPENLTGRKVVVEFEGMRQAGQVFVNGKAVGLSENGVTAYGLDISDALNIGGDNVLAVRIDNSSNYAEKSSGTVFEWEAKDFNPNYGGINRHVWLHVMGPIHQTLPIYDGLGTTGVYVYPSNISAADGALDVNVESQVANESGDQASITLSGVVVDAGGRVRAKFDGDTVDLVNGEKTILRASGILRCGCGARTIRIFTTFTRC